MPLSKKPPLLGLLFLLAGLPFSGITIAQQSEKSEKPRIVLQWTPPSSTQITENEIIKLLHFEGAVYDGSRHALPYYTQLIPNPFPGNEVTVTMEDPLFEPVRDEGIIIPEGTGSDFKVTATVGKQKRKELLGVSVQTVRLTASGSLERLVSFTLSYTPAGPKKTASAQRVYASSSVLSSGSWYKISVVADGVHKITADLLRQLGMNPENVNPSKLRLFGNGGGMLPFLNATYRHDDLVENAVEVYDGGTQGVFDDSDYVLFYGEGPHNWYYDPSDGRYHHTIHLYSNQNFYFLSPDYNNGNAPKRIQTQASVSGTPTGTATSFDDYSFHEKDLLNLTKSGRQWYGEQFDADLTQSFSFSFPNIDSSVPVYVKSHVVATSLVNSSFRVNYGTQSVLLQSVPAVGAGYTADKGADNISNGVFTATSSNIELTLTYYPTSSTSIGYLNYLELNARRQLRMSGAQMHFRDKLTVGPGNLTNFILDPAGLTCTVWEITDPTTVSRQQFSSGTSFQVTTDSLRSFIAFTGAEYKFPTPAGIVSNQNLHASGPQDLLIVTHPQFAGEAERLASFRRSHDNLRVQVITPDQVYNEFSSGVRDITAIKDYVRMLYDKAGSVADMPRYLLLFGDGSYDNKSTSESNTNFLPTYQSLNSLSLIFSYVSDDYFGFLDEYEGDYEDSLPDLLDIGIGRFPVKNSTEAATVVNKVIDYSTPGTFTGGSSVCSDGNTSSLGDWRNILCFIADDEDGNMHLNQVNDVANTVRVNHPVYNIDKIYIDAYRQVSTPGGKRFPEVNDAINKRMERGALIVNYAGHGGETGWTEERILDNAMITSWTNVRKLPLFVTATCEFSRYDDPGRTSAGELVLINSEAGGIGLMTTTRLVYAQQNGTLNSVMMGFMFEPVNGVMPRLGDIYVDTKNNTSVIGTGVNAKHFTILGDPSMILAYTKYDVVTTAINGAPLVADQDTLGALEKVTISGEIRNNGVKLTNFNGIIYPTVFDKSVNVSTLSNDPTSPLKVFSLQKNALYRGKASVTNGDFTYTFIVPKDIAYQIGRGRLSYYAHNGAEDANGVYDSVMIGGTSGTTITDTDGPVIKLFMNDEKFVFGGTTDEHPKILALVTDTNGINTVGNGIGHDITAQLDDEPENIYVLNDFYESDLDSYQSGRVVYPLASLSNGRHTLKLKVWDIYNNSSEAYTEFVVAESATLALNHVLNYPNPFTTRTSFFFEHNRPCNTLDVQVQIFTVSGKLIKTIDRTVTCEGYRVDDIEWDGRDDFGDHIGKGVYVYRLKIRDLDGASAEKYEKLVLLK
jgi:hypothetical protein